MISPFHSAIQQKNSLDTTESKTSESQNQTGDIESERLKSYKENIAKMLNGFKKIRFPFPGEKLKAGIAVEGLFSLSPGDEIFVSNFHQEILGKMLKHFFDIDTHVSPSSSTSPTSPASPLSPTAPTSPTFSASFSSSSTSSPRSSSSQESAQQSSLLRLPKRTKVFALVNPPDVEKDSSSFYFLYAMIKLNLCREITYSLANFGTFHARLVDLKLQSPEGAGIGNGEEGGEKGIREFGSKGKEGEAETKSRGECRKEDEDEDGDMDEEEDDEDEGYVKRNERWIVDTLILEDPSERNRLVFITDGQCHERSSVCIVDRVVDRSKWPWGTFAATIVIGSPGMFSRCSFKWKTSEDVKQQWCERL